MTDESPNKKPKFSREDEAVGHLFAETKTFLVSLFGMVEGKTEVWGKLPDYWKKDRDVACAALNSDCCTFQYLPQDLRDDRPFLAACVEKQPYFWYQLHDDIKNDLPFVRSINIDKLDGDHADDILDFFRTHETLVYDGDFWKATIASFDHNLTHLFKNLPLHGLNESSYCKLVERNFYLEYVDLSLLRDKEFVKATFSPRTFSCLGRFDLRAADKVNSEFWQDRSFLEAWFRSGEPFLQNLFQHLGNDKDIFLWIAEGGDVASFAQASPHLCRDKAFMMKCVSLNPWTFREAVSEELQKDFDFRSPWLLLARRLHPRCLGIIWRMTTLPITSNKRTAKSY